MEKRVVCNIPVHQSIQGLQCKRLENSVPMVESIAGLTGVDESVDPHQPVGIGWRCRRGWDQLDQ